MHFIFMDLTTILVYLATFVVAYFTLVVCKKFFSSKNNLKYKLPPCIPRLPFIGSLPFIPNAEKFYIYFMKKSKSLGNVIGFYLGNEYHVILNSRKTIHEALAKKALHFASRPVFRLGSPFNPHQKGIIEHPYDDEFKIHHRACLNVLKKFGLGQEGMEERIKSEIEYSIQMIKLKKGQPFYPLSEVTSTFFNVIGRILYGRRLPIDDPEFIKCQEISRNIAQGFVLNFFPMLRFKSYFKGYISFLFKSMNIWEDYIEKKIKSVLDEVSVKTFSVHFSEELKGAVSDSDENESQQITEKEHKVLVRDFMVAGTETSSTTVLWFIYYMANHQDIQKQLRDEIDRVVGSNRLPCTEDKPNLPITEACMHEVMRIRTLVPLAVPHLTLKESVIDGVYIPEGVIVVANLYSAHMDPDVWDEPEKFKIERFLNEDRNKVVNQDLIIPFSLGKRSCIGEPLARQELFLFISSLIHEFHILPPEGQSHVIVDEIVGATICPSPFNVRLVERI